MEYFYRLFNTAEQMCDKGYDSYCEESSSTLGIVAGALAVSAAAVGGAYAYMTRQQNAAQDQAPEVDGPRRGPARECQSKYKR